MTELENHLLNALRDLSQQFKEQHMSSRKSLQALEVMFKHTSEENRVLMERVEILQNQVRELSRQTTDFAILYEKNK